jgi:hypothetical protein
MESPPPATPAATFIRWREEEMQRRHQLDEEDEQIRQEIESRIGQQLHDQDNNDDDDSDDDDDEDHLLDSSENQDQDWDSQSLTDSTTSEVAESPLVARG